MKLKLLFAVVALLSGCATQTMYHWGNYSGTLYNLNNEYSERNKERHYQELLQIVAVASSKNKVPPGIYFELGMFEARKGNVAQSQEYFNKEMQAFPESRVFVERVLQGQVSE